MSWLAAMALSLSGCATSAAPAPPVAVQRGLVLMGTYARIDVTASSRAEGLRLTEVAFAALRLADDDLSTWRPETPVSRLNRAPVGEPQPVADVLWASLAAAFDIGRETGGAFDPAVGAISEAWGIHSGGRVPATTELRAARAAVGSGGFWVDRAAQAVCRLHPRAALDTGGFGKGAALDRAGEALRREGCERALLDLGGQMLAIGGPFEVEVAHPRSREVSLGAYLLRDASISTSGNSERAVETSGRTIGHILDPDLAEPASDIGSVTVLAPTALEADALSTALFVLGPDAGLELLRSRSDTNALFARVSPGLRLELREIGPERLRRHAVALAGPRRVHRRAGRR